MYDCDGSLLDMDIAQIIEQTFPGSLAYSLTIDQSIRQTPYPLELEGSPNLLELIPAYMQWCIRNRDNYNQLVTDHTVDALAEYGRAKQADNEYLNFKFQCTLLQKQAVIAFLKWCLSDLLIQDEEQIQRTIKQWQKSLT